MDERESIPRRETVVGLGLLALLATGLVGTIVFRIVNAAPRNAELDPTAVALSDRAAVGNSADPTASAGVAARPLATAHQEPIGAEGVGGLPEVTPTAASEGSSDLPAAITSEAPRWSPMAAPGPPAERPRFVAPANR
jgi:hypothetical protein